MTIRMRIALFAAGVVTITLLLFGALLYTLTAVGAGAQQDQMLTQRAGQAANLAGRTDRDELHASRPLAPIDLATSAETFIEALDADGSVIASGGLIDGAPPMIPPSLLEAARAGRPAFATLKPAPRITLRVRALPFTTQDGASSGYIVAGQTRRDRERQLAGLRGFLVIAAGLTLATALGGCWFAAGRALRPLKTIAHTADTIGATEDLGRRLPERSPRDEIGALTASFNGMLRRLGDSQAGLTAANRRLLESLAAQQRFVADASHELRTPLTTIRNNAGFLLQHPHSDAADREAAAQDIAGESERMSRLVTDLLTLARADAGSEPERTPLDPESLLRDLVRQAQRLHPDRAIHALVAEDLSPLCVVANADALARLLWILIDNAVKHTASPGEISVRLSCAADRALIEVVDQGPGIAPADLPRIFDRFFQADQARASEGAGLGLAIAQWIAQTHGGRLTAHNNAVRGATFRVALPLATA